MLDGRVGPGRGFLASFHEDFVGMVSGHQLRAFVDSAKMSKTEKNVVGFCLSEVFKIFAVLLYFSFPDLALFSQGFCNASSTGSPSLVLNGMCKHPRLLS